MHAPLVSAEAPPSIPYEKYRLANGLEVILSQDRTLPLVAVDVWYHVGAANEEPGRTGFAHLFEHMMFTGSKHVPRGVADKLLEGVGGTDSNATTSFDRTNYFDTVPSNQLELALWIHADRMGYLLDSLDQAALSNQQDVVRNERRQSYENRPYGIVDEAVFHALFPQGHPYRPAIIGSHVDIQAAALADVRDFFKRYYRPNNATLTLVGDFDTAAAKRLVQKYFGSFKGGPEVPKPAVMTPALTSEKRLTVTDQIELERLDLAWLTAPKFKPGDAELTIAGYILAGGKSSRLYKKLVYELQVAQEVSAGQDANALTSIFEIEAIALSGHTAAELQPLIDVELDRVRAWNPRRNGRRRSHQPDPVGGGARLGRGGLATLPGGRRLYRFSNLRLARRLAVPCRPARAGNRGRVSRRQHRTTRHARTRSSGSGQCRVAGAAPRYRSHPRSWKPGGQATPGRGRWPRTKRDRSLLPSPPADAS